MYGLKHRSKVKNLETKAPEAMKRFVASDKAAAAHGAIPVKYKELDGPRRRLYHTVPILHRDPPNNARAVDTSDVGDCRTVVAAALRAGGASPMARTR